MRGDFISGNKSGTVTVERRFVNAIRYVTLCCVCVCVRASTSAIARVSTSMRSACVVNRDSMCGTTANAAYNGIIAYAWHVCPFPRPYPTGT